eukprot:tig00000076_g2450.t1
MIVTPSTDGAVDVERTNDGMVAIVLSVLGIDAVSSATVACTSTATQIVVDPVTVLSILSSPTSIIVQVPLEALTGYQCTATTTNAGGTSSADTRTFVTKKGLAPVVAQRSVASGPAACEYQIVGWTSSLVVQAFDADGLIVSGRNPGTLSVQLVPQTASDPTDPAFSALPQIGIINYQNGTFLVEVQVPRRRGTYELQLSLATGDPATSGAIASSPVRFFALPSMQTKVSFEGVSSSVKALKGFPVSFIGVYRDRNDNYMGNVPAGVAASSCPAAIDFRSSAGTASAPPVAASISASPAAPVDIVTTKGTYGAGGTWVDKFVLTGKTSVDGSATVTVTGTVGASVSTVTTISLTAGDIAISKSGVFGDICRAYTAGRPFTFRIELRNAQDERVDAFSNITVTPTYLGPASTVSSSETVFTLPDNFKAVVNPNSFPSAATVAVSVNADGSYTASITAFKAGYYKLSVAINGQAAGVGSSVAVFVSPGEPATSPDAAYPTYVASRLEWLASSSPHVLAGQATTAYVAVRDALGNLVEQAAYQSLADSETTLRLGFGAAAAASSCSIASEAIPSPWAASTLSLAAPANVISLLPVLAVAGFGGSARSWNVSEQSSASSGTVAGVYQVTFSTCSTGIVQIQATRSGTGFGGLLPLTVKPNILASIRDASALKESIAGPLAAEALNSLRLTGVDQCGNVIDFDQAPNDVFEFTFSGGFAKLPFFADFTTAAGATPLCSYVRYQGVIGCFRDLAMARVPGTTGIVTISYKLYATGSGTLDLFVNAKQTTFIEGSRMASADAPAARVAVARTPKDPIQILSAKFSDVGNTVLFTLSEDSDMLQSYMGTPGAALDSARNVRASAIFRDAATLFGSASYCSFVRPSVLEVTIAGVNDQNIGGLAKLLSAVSIASSGAPILNAIGNSAPIPDSAPAIVIQAPANPPTPVIQLTGDVSVGRCNPAEYFVKVEGGGCGRPLTLQWTVTQGGIAVDPALYRISGTALRILASAPTGSYLVAVQAQNFLNKPSVQQTIALAKTNTEIPSVVIAEGAKLETAKTADTTLTARATFSACSSSSTIEMEFRWFIDEVEQVGETSSTFTIGPNGKLKLSLLPRTTPYKVEVEGNVRTDASLRNSFTTELTVKAAKLVADARSFSESAGQLKLTSTVGVDSNIVLDATKSFDPDNVDAVAGFDTMLACKWTLGASSPTHALPLDPDGFLISGPGVALPSEKNGCVLQITARTLQPDKASPQKPFSFAVHVTRTDGLDRAAAMAAVPVVIAEYAPPSVSISLEGSRTVNAFRELKLTGAVEAPKDIDAADFKANGESVYKLQYLWTVQSASTLDLQDKGITESSTGSSLVLKKNVLRPGQAYTFALSVTLEKDGKTRTASAEVTLEVNRPPASGSCKLLEPLADGGLLDVIQGAKSVTALSKEYRLSCGDWVTGSPPLQYAFEAEEVGAGSRTTLRSYSSDSTLTKIKAYPVKGALL